MMQIWEVALTLNHGLIRIVLGGLTLLWKIKQMRIVKHRKGYQMYSFLKNNFIFLMLLCATANASFSPAIELPATEIEQIKKITAWRQDTALPIEKNVDTFYFENKHGERSGIVFSDANRNIYITFRTKLDEQVDATILDDNGVIKAYQSVYEGVNQSLSVILGKLFNKETTVTFCGQGDEGAIATLAAHDFINSKNSAENQVRLITFFAPPVANSHFITKLHEKLHMENALSFIINPIATTNTQYLSAGIQVGILPTELVEDYGLRGALKTARILGYCFHLTDLSYDKQMSLPSFEILRKIVAHYQLSYFAYKSDFDHCDLLQDVGNVSLFSTSRGIFKSLYKMIS
jgi:hypothetical protein